VTDCSAKEPFAAENAAENNHVQEEGEMDEHGDEKRKTGFT